MCCTYLAYNELESVVIVIVIVTVIVIVVVTIIIIISITSFVIINVMIIVWLHVCPVTADVMLPVLEHS